MTVRIGVLGAGVMGSSDARILHHSIAGATVTAVTDPIRERALTVAEEVGAQIVDTAEALITSMNTGGSTIPVHAPHEPQSPDNPTTGQEHEKTTLHAY